MRMEDRLERARARCLLRREALAAKAGLGRLLTPAEYAGYHRYAPQRLWQVSRVLALPAFMLLAALWAGYALYIVTSKLQRAAEWLLCLLYPFPLRFFFWAVVWAARGLYPVRVLVARLAAGLWRLAAWLYHGGCELLAGIFIGLCRIPAVVWAATRLMVPLRWVGRVARRLARRLLLAALYAKALLAGMPTVLGLPGLALRAMRGQVQPAAHSLPTQVLALYLPDGQAEKREPEKPAPGGEALFATTLPGNAFAALLQGADSRNALSAQEYALARQAPFAAAEVMAACAALRRRPAPVANAVLLHCLFACCQGVPVKAPALPGLAAHSRFFAKAPRKLAPARYVVCLPVTLYDLPRVKNGCLLELLYSLCLLLGGARFHLLLVLPVCGPPAGRRTLEKEIAAALAHSFVPENSSWEALAPTGDFADLLNYRGLQMLYGLRHICQSDAFADDTRVVLSELNLSASPQCLYEMAASLDAMPPGGVVAGSRYIPGACALNKPAITHIHSRVYNTYARIRMPNSPCSDSSSPLKLTSKAALQALLPGLEFCAPGMLDFTFDEGFLAVAACMRVPVAESPLFWLNRLPPEATRHSSGAWKNQLRTTRILAKRVWMLESLAGHRGTGTPCRLGTGMDFAAWVDSGYTVRKYPVRPLNRLELLLAARGNGQARHDRFGALGGAAIRILPDGAAKRLGRVAEGGYRDPLARLPYLLEKTKGCGAVAATWMEQCGEDGYCIQQAFAPLPFKDLLDYQQRYGCREGLKAMLDRLLTLNQTLIAHGMFDKDFRSLYDVGVFLHDPMECKYLDFADFVTDKAYAARLLRQGWWDALTTRRDMRYLAKSCTGNRQTAALFFGWCARAGEVFSPEALHGWGTSGGTTTSAGYTTGWVPRQHATVVRQLTLLRQDGLPAMASKALRERYTGLLPGLETAFDPTPLPGILRDIGAARRAAAGVKVLLLANNPHIAQEARLFMARHLPEVPAQVLGGGVDGRSIRQLDFRAIALAHGTQDTHLLILPMDGHSSRMRPVLQGLPHKAFIRVHGRPLLFWAINSCLGALEAIKTGPVVLYLHGDTLPVFPPRLPGGNTAFIDPVLYRALRRARYAAPQGEAGSATKALGRLLPKSPPGHEYPGMFAVRAADVPRLRPTSLAHSFWASAAHMLAPLRGVHCVLPEAFWDVDCADDLFLLQLVAHTGSGCEGKTAVDGGVTLVAKGIHVGEGALLRVTSGAAHPVKLYLEDIIVESGCALTLHITAGGNVHARRLVCMQGSASLVLPQTGAANLLLAGTAGARVSPAEPFSYYSGGEWRPMFSEYAPQTRPDGRKYDVVMDT